MTTACLEFTGIVAGNGGDAKELSRAGGTALVGSNVTLPSPPAAAAVVSEFDLTVSVSSDMGGNADAIAVAVTKEASLDPLPGTTDDASGTWSGGVNGSQQTFLTSTADGWYSDDFGHWLTDSVSVPTTSATNDLVYASGASSNTEFNVAQIDVRIRARHSDWSGESNGVLVARGNSYTALSAVWTWYISSGTMFFTFRRAGDESNFSTASVSLATLGVTNGAWSWLRVTVDSANGVRFWTSTDGSSWTVAATVAVSGHTITTSSSWSWHVAQLNCGNQATSGHGFGGDVAAMQFYAYAGSLIADLNLADQTSSSDTTWTSTTGVHWSHGSNVTNNGAFVGSVTFHFTFEIPAPFDEFRVIVDCFHGEATIDEWCLDYITGGGWSVGFLKF